MQIRGSGKTSNKYNECITIMWYVTSDLTYVGSPEKCAWHVYIHIKNPSKLLCTYPRRAGFQVHTSLEIPRELSKFWRNNKKRLSTLLWWLPPVKLISILQLAVDTFSFIFFLIIQPSVGATEVERVLKAISYTKTIFLNVKTNCSILKGNSNFYLERTIILNRDYFPIKYLLRDLPGIWTN